jgi:hypothetical protein
MSQQSRDRYAAGQVIKTLLQDENKPETKRARSEVRNKLRKAYRNLSPSDAKRLLKEVQRRAEAERVCRQLNSGERVLRYTTNRVAEALTSRKGPAHVFNELKICQLIFQKIEEFYGKRAEYEHNRRLSGSGKSGGTCGNAQCEVCRRDY